MTTQGGYNSYQQSEPAGDAGGYDPGADYSPAATHQGSGGGYDPSTAYTTATVPKKERSVSMEGAAKGLVLTLIIAGIILLLVAKIYAAGLTKLDYDPWEDDADDVQKEMENIQYNTTVINAIGLALIPMGLLMAAIAMEGLGTHVRSGLAIAAGIIIGLSAFLPIVS